MIDCSKPSGFEAQLRCIGDENIDDILGLDKADFDQQSLEAQGRSIVCKNNPAFKEGRCLDQPSNKQTEEPKIERVEDDRRSEVVSGGREVQQWAAI